MEYEQMKAMLETHCCTQCEAPLTLIWDGQANEYRLVCGTDRSHEGYKALGSPIQAIVRGKGDKVLGPGAQEGLEKQLAMATNPLSMLPLKDLGTDKDLTANQVATLVKWAERVGLKAYLGHVCLYYGKPYRTIDGLYYTLSKKHMNIAVGSRPLTAQERADYMIAEGDYAWLAEGWDNGKKLPTTGLGIVTKEEIEAKSEKKPEHFRAPIARAHPQRMAEKRAEWQLLRKEAPLAEEEENT